ncbi:Mth938-like domain-containing protein [Litoreibacter roseus]|uniref:Membrane protein n=1 Tax=Litoreibacter roseus TaxID=2601869 RepID=A0A6N6JIG8_9RHOB|nr:Mth938-like domain-containing protein [Litoreibacter roseus]GFE65875.1 membrane protein [Litoreibacter roseus]
MRLTEISYDTAPPVDGYGPGFFRIGGEVHEGGLVLLPNKIIPWTGYEDTAAILSAAGAIDVLFVGTGPEIAHIPAAFRDTLDEAGIGVELMATPTACRTYNVLLSEGRRIGAALTPIIA